ncbi:hypothetical protein JCM10207_000059 [Rhodosporidiobolus poonsookiae]
MRFKNANLPWTASETAEFVAAVKRHGPRWPVIERKLGKKRSAGAYYVKWRSIQDRERVEKNRAEAEEAAGAERDESEVIEDEPTRKAAPIPWTKEEDAKLKSFVHYGRTDLKRAKKHFKLRSEKDIRKRVTLLGLRYVKATTMGSARDKAARSSSNFDSDTDGDADSAPDATSSDDEVVLLLRPNYSGNKKRKAARSHSRSLSRSSSPSPSSMRAEKKPRSTRFAGDYGRGSWQSYSDGGALDMNGDEDDSDDSQPLAGPSRPRAGSSTADRRRARAAPPPPSSRTPRRDKGKGKAAAGDAFVTQDDFSALQDYFEESLHRMRDKFDAHQERL